MRKQNYLRLRRVLKITKDLLVILGLILAIILQMKHL